MFEMVATTAPRLVHRTAHIRLRLTRRQTTRCYALLRSAGDVWAWLLDTNRHHRRHGLPEVTNYQALCRKLTQKESFGGLGVTGARSVLRRYADAWFQAAKRRKAGQQDAGFPRRKRALVPVRFYHGTFRIEGRRVRLPVARGQPDLWVRLARPLPYPPEQVRAVTLLADGGRLWLAVTAAIPTQQDHDLDPDRLAGVDLGVIHPYAASPSRSPSPASGRQAGRRLRRAAAGRDAGGRRPHRHHEARCGQGAELAAAAVAPHPPTASAAGQGRASRDRGAAGG